MQIVIVAATEMELNTLKDGSFDISHNISMQIHGIGILQATYHLQKIAYSKPDLIIQIGIAGAYNKQLNLGECVFVESECLGDVGAEDHHELLDLYDLGFNNKNEFPFSNGVLYNHSKIKPTHLKAVQALTVNLSTGSQETYNRRLAKFNADIESMEGACLHYICLQESIPFIQFRGISNYVGPRDKDLWQINKALHNCQTEVIKFVHQLHESAL